MQFVGLASAALLTPPAFWGWRLLTRRRLERPRLKIGLYLGGVIAAAALASLLPTPGSWPLPTGLGGVVGDAVLSIPRRALPVSTWATVVLGACLAGLSILALAAAAGVGGPSRAPGDGVAQNPAGRARAEALARFDDEEDEDEPSFGMVSIGAVIHALLTAKGALRRIARRGARTPGKSSPILGPAPTPPATRAPWSNSQRCRRRIDRSGRLCSPPARLGPDLVRRRAAGRYCARRAQGREPSRRRGQVRLIAARVDHALDRNADRAEKIGRDPSFAGRAGAECAPARGRPRRFRRQGRDRQRASGASRRPLRARAGAGDQVVASDRARRRHRPVDVGRLGPRGRSPGPQRHRRRTAEPAPGDGLPARASRQRGLRELEASARHRARQDDRRRAGDRRPRPNASPPGRRHDRLWQVGGDQHHDPLARLTA